MLLKVCSECIFRGNANDCALEVFSKSTFQVRTRGANSREMNSCFDFLGFLERLYESPGGNLVDGLPPASSTSLSESNMASRDENRSRIAILF